MMNLFSWFRKRREARVEKTSQRVTNESESCYLNQQYAISQLLANQYAQNYNHNHEANRYGIGQVNTTPEKKREDDIALPWMPSLTLDFSSGAEAAPAQSVDTPSADSTPDFSDSFSGGDSGGAGGGGDF